MWELSVEICDGTIKSFLTNNKYLLSNNFSVHNHTGCISIHSWAIVPRFLVVFHHLYCALICVSPCVLSSKLCSTFCTWRTCRSIAPLSSWLNTSTADVNMNALHSLWVLYHVFGTRGGSASTRKVVGTLGCVHMMSYAERLFITSNICETALRQGKFPG
jgi:hypothetical protein